MSALAIINARILDPASDADFSGSCLIEDGLFAELNRGTGWPAPGGLRGTHPHRPVRTGKGRRREVANRATAIRATAPSRSDQRARLKNNHHTRRASPPKTPPMTP